MPGTLVTWVTKHAWNAFRWRLDMPGTFENFEIRFPRTSYTLGPIGLAQIMGHEKNEYFDQTGFDLKCTRFPKVPGM